MDLEKLKALIDLFSASTLAELELREGETTVRLRRDAIEMPALPRAPAAPSPRADASPPPAAETAIDRGLVCAPGPGVFHRAPEPGAAPFVTVGTEVQPGRQLAILEAMKVFTAVTAPRAGRVVEILAADGAEVDTGVPLIRIA